MLWLENEHGGYRFKDHSRRGGAHLMPSQLFEVFNERPEDAGFKFAIVRNPWDRVATYYLRLKEDIGFDDSFEEYILTEKFLIDPVSISCYNYAKYADRVLRYETLIEDFKYIQEFYNNPTPLSEHYNRSILPNDYTVLYNEKMIDFVANLYASDIKQYGYEYGK